MKYRVKQIGKWYYPQYKWLCFWRTIQEERVQQNLRYEMVDVKFSSLDSAKNKITLHKISLKKEKVIINIWEIE